jgi:GT2 family glycosyltransferase
VVEEAVRACENGANAVLIHNTSDPSISLWSRARKLERDCYWDESIRLAVRFFSRSDFVAVGGFLETLVAAEDYDLHYRLLRLGIRIARIKSKEIHIGEPRRLRDVVEKNVYYGKHIRAFIRANPKAAWKQITPLRMAFVRHWRDFLVDPRITVAFLIYQYVRYLSALAGSMVDLVNNPRS